MRRGRLLESAIATWYAEEMGSDFVVTDGEEMPVGGADKLVQSWMLASPDRYVHTRDQAVRFGLEVSELPFLSLPLAASSSSGGSRRIRWSSRAMRLLVRTRPLSLSTPQPLSPYVKRRLFCVSHCGDDTRPIRCMQVKTARTTDGWGMPGQAGGVNGCPIPVYYRTQCAWYMAVTGLSRWDVAVYFIENDEFRR